LAIRVWNSSDGRLLGKLNCREQEVLKFLEGTLGIDSAGRRIVVPSVLHLTCWDVDSGQVRRVDVTPGSVFGIVLSQDGRRCYRYSCPGGLDYSLEVSDCDSGETLWSVKFQDPSIPLRSWGPLSLSPSGRYVALSTTVFDTETGSVAWTCEETSRSRGLFGAEYACFLDEEHVLVNVDASYQVWNWRENRRDLNLLLMYKDDWAIVDAQGNFKASDLGESRLQLRHVDDQNRETWLTPAEYARRTGWKNVPSKVGFRVAIPTERDLTGPEKSQR